MTAMIFEDIAGKPVRGSVNVNASEPVPDATTVLIEMPDGRMARMTRRVPVDAPTP